MCFVSTAGIPIHRGDLHDTPQGWCSEALTAEHRWEQRLDRPPDSLLPARLPLGRQHARTSHAGGQGREGTHPAGKSC